MLRAGTILVNHDGSRFSEELSRPELDIPHQAAREAFLVFDATVASKFQAWPNFVSTAPGIAYAYLDDYKRTRPDLYHEAPTIEALSTSLGVPAATLEATIDSYNQGLSAAGSTDRQKIMRAPYYALGPVQSWIVFTEGGLAVSARHEVITKDGAPVAGLYAVGSAGQGGAILAGHGHHIGWAMTSGRRVGRIIAASLASRSSTR